MLANRSKSSRFPGQQREGLEVGNHVLEEILESAGFPLHSPVATVRTNASAPEVRLQRMKHLSAISVLADGQAGPHLPPREQRCSRSDGNGEASFAVDVTGDVRREELATIPGAGV
jgi:hypothetical protein